MPRVLGMSSMLRVEGSDLRMVELIARRSVASIVRSLALQGPMTCVELTTSTLATEQMVRRDLAVLTAGDFVAELRHGPRSESTYILNTVVLADAATGHVDYVLGR